MYRETFGAFDSLYLGGGTPSLFGSRQMKTLMNTLMEHFSLAHNTEITIEVNPDDVTGDKLECWRKLGVNRISLGVQSFNDEELLFLKRRHDVFAAERALGLISSYGFRNYSIDLMYGLPGQREDSWTKTLERALTFKPTHLSCYQFTLEERTPYGQLKAEGKLQLLGEKEEKALFLLTSAYLKARGFIHYEISNFAVSREYESRHNLKYWRHVPYLGLGPAAHSFKDGVRWWNHRSVENYCGVLSRGKKPVEDTEMLSREQLRLERLFLGFRTDHGVAVSDLTCQPTFNEILMRAKQSRLVTVRNNRIIPTRKGYLVADRLPLMFCD